MRKPQNLQLMFANGLASPHATATIMRSTNKRVHVDSSNRTDIQLSRQGLQHTSHRTRIRNMKLRDERPHWSIMFCIEQKGRNDASTDNTNVHKRPLERDRDDIRNSCCCCCCCCYCCNIKDTEATVSSICTTGHKHTTHAD